MGETSLGDKRALSSMYKHITDGTCLQLGFNIFYPRMLLERPRDKNLLSHMSLGPGPSSLWKKPEE